jgi:hypothetical protein
MHRARGVQMAAASDTERIQSAQAHTAHIQVCWPAAATPHVLTRTRDGGLGSRGAAPEGSVTRLCANQPPPALHPHAGEGWAGWGERSASGSHSPAHGGGGWGVGTAPRRGRRACGMLSHILPNQRLRDGASAAPSPSSPPRKKVTRHGT